MVEGKCKRMPACLIGVEERQKARRFLYKVNDIPKLREQKEVSLWKYTDTLP